MDDPGGSQSWHGCANLLSLTPQGILTPPPQTSCFSPFCGCPGAPGGPGLGLLLLTPAPRAHPLPVLTDTEPGRLTHSPILISGSDLWSVFPSLNPAPRGLLHLQANVSSRLVCCPGQLPPAPQLSVRPLGPPRGPTPETSRAAPAPLPAKPAPRAFSRSRPSRCASFV